MYTTHKDAFQTDFILIYCFVMQISVLSEKRKSFALGQSI